MITSNLTLEQLARHYESHGDRLASRIAGYGYCDGAQGEGPAPPMNCPENRRKYGDEIIFEVVDSSAAAEFMAAATTSNQRKLKEEGLEEQGTVKWFNEAKGYGFIRPRRAVGLVRALQRHPGQWFQDPERRPTRWSSRWARDPRGAGAQCCGQVRIANVRSLQTAVTPPVWASSPQ